MPAIQKGQMLDMGQQSCIAYLPYYLRNLTVHEIEVGDKIAMGRLFIYTDKEARFISFDMHQQARDLAQTLLEYLTSQDFHLEHKVNLPGDAN